MMAIQVKDLRHRFGDHEALRGLSFEVPERTIYGLVGANGAGKTTTIRILATLLAPTEGRVWIAGLEIGREPREVRRVLGFMPDAARIDERLSVTELLDFYAAVHGIARAARARAVAAVIELCRLGALADRRATGLSKGMRQRIVLARTLLHDPQVLVLDEPASDLDPRARVELRELLLEVRSLGKTILLSSHILSELEPLCDGVAIIERGALVASGTVAQIAERLRTDRPVRMRFADSSSASALSALEGLEGVAATRVDPRTLSLSVRGGDASLAAAVRRVVEAGAPLVAVEPERQALEHAFLELTAGEVQ
jgi:ABC-2 type transport system ATP-binding protein